MTALQYPSSPRPPFSTMSPVTIPRAPVDNVYESPAKMNGSQTKTHLNGDGNVDAVEDYNGSYKFAPIEEAEVSRAMIKR